MSIGKRIKDIRESKNISQTDLANAVNISKQTLWKYENDVIINIPSDVIEAIAKHLCVSPITLMGWDSVKNTTGGYYYYYYPEETEDNAPAGIELTPHEQEVLAAYRAKAEMQKAVDTLLGVAPAPAPTIADDMKNTIALGEAVFGKTRTDAK